MSTHDLDVGFIEFFLSSAWSVAFVLAVALGFVVFLTGAFMHSSQSRMVNLLTGFILMIAGMFASISNFSHYSEHKRSDAVETWVAETYGLDVDIHGDKIAELVSRNRVDSIPVKDDDRNRVLNLVVTSNGDLVLVNNGGREVDHDSN